MINLKTKDEIIKIRNASKVATKTLEYISSFLKPEITTEEINRLCHNFIIKNKGIPAPLNYHGFPKSICTSVNDVVCHGIPSEKVVLKDGDIINIDVTVKLDDYHGDTSRTFIIGEASPDIINFVNRVEKSMWRGIKEIKPGKKLYNIGRSIENYIKKFNYSVVRDYVGHGIGKGFHESPQVLHYCDTNENNIILKPGMVFTIEPMINMGNDFKVIVSPDDKWTVRTVDGSFSSQFEHTVLVTDHGFEVLSFSDKFLKPN